MEMSYEEIRKNYEEAKNKKAQLRILADMNLCSVADIKDILEGREPKPKEPKRPGRPKKEEQAAEPKQIIKPKAAAALVPKVVHETLIEKLEVLEDRIENCQKIADKALDEKETYSEEYETIANFLKGVKVC